MAWPAATGTVQLYKRQPAVQNINLDAKQNKQHQPGCKTKQTTSTCGAKFKKKNINMECVQRLKPENTLSKLKVSLVQAPIDT